jgi:hypothetical protein
MTWKKKLLRITGYTLLSILAPYSPDLGYMFILAPKEG